MNIKKTFRIGRAKLMLSSGLKKNGQVYIYGGVKDRSGLSAGASIGTRGSQIYGSYNKNGNQARIMHNLTTGIIKPRVRLRW